MTQGGFDKVDASDTLMYGPRKIVLCGFSAETQPKFQALFETIGVRNLPLVWAQTHAAGWTLEEIFGLPDASGDGETSDLPRAIIVAGITQKELHALMNGCRQAGLRPPLWAVLTPTSEKWSLIKLLAELEAERMFMTQRGKQKK